MIDLKMQIGDRPFMRNRDRLSCESLIDQDANNDEMQFAKTLHESGRLKKSAKGDSYQSLTPRLKHLGGIRQRAYLIRAACS